MKKISVIIPVYNAMTSGGGYINRCVSSVINQKNFPVEDVEVILINDGSKDNSLEVLKQIEKENPTLVRLIDQDNMGVAKTRNKGIELAQGEYVTFLDQDDWIDDDFFSVLYNQAAKDDVDVITSGYRRPDEKGGVTRVFKPNGDRPYGLYMVSAAWAKLHRTRFIIEHNIQFFDNGFGEDIPFMLTENVNANRYKIVPYVGYNWFNNKSSVSNTVQKELTISNTVNIENLFKEISTISVDEKNVYFDYYLLRTAVYSILDSSRTSTPDEFIRIKDRIFDILSVERWVSLRKRLLKLLIPPKGERFGVSCVVGIFLLLEQAHLLRILAFFWCRKQPSVTSK